MKTLLLGKRILAVLMVCALLFTTLPTAWLVGAADMDDTVADDTVTGGGDNTEEELPDDPETGGDGTEEEVPGDTPSDDEELDLSNATAVATADELEQALANGDFAIRLVADFELDRTFYIAQDTYIFSEEAIILTRSATFGGDVFVIGEIEDGVACESGATLSFGHPESTASDLLIIDGNKQQMTVDVTGTVFYVVTGSRADLYSNVTVRNAHKNGNAKTISAGYGVSYPPRVGGAVAILTNKSTMNIYGGNYTDNSANDISEGETEDETLYSAQGGAIYNFGTLSIYGGTFARNHAARGGFLYDYRTARIYNAQIVNNTASGPGGAVYMPNSTSARLYLGGENALVESKVVFEDNTAASYGGAIYARNILTVENTTFSNNATTASSGGAIYGGSMTLTIDNATFTNNTAKKYGGAVYHTGSNEKDDVVELTVTNATFETNTAVSDGGAIYLSGETRAYVAASQFVQNSSGDGGAIYLTAGHLDADGVEFLGNSSSSTGGAVAAYSSSSAKMNAVTASGNKGAGGGFACVSASEFNLYNSLIYENTSTKNGGGILMENEAFGGIYATTFEKNVASSNGGAVFVYTAGGDVTINSCSFIENEGDYGGALYASNKSILHLYNTIATKNAAIRGGAFYITTTGTTVDLIAVTVSGNTATEGGPIIWGNSTGAVLNIDKGKYIDPDHTGEWDDAYWAAAIYNKLKVNAVTESVPNYIDYDGKEITPDVPEVPSDVTSAAQLESALGIGKSLIRVTGDFEIDRTIYITFDTTIYSVEQHTITRAADFAGDMFVVGQDADGDRRAATLTLGDKESTTENLLIIDGNKNNMTVDVVGSVLFVVTGSGAELYDNLTIQNAHKMGNERTIATPYGMSYPPRIGGAMLIMSNKTTVNIYGGNYTDNSANDISEGETEDETLYSAQGGAIYNFGTLSIYGGTFARNHAARGGFLFSYRTANIYNAQIVNNTSSGMGGAVYMPNSTSARMYLGGINDLAESYVVFDGNTSVSHGGAIYARNLLSVENTTFQNNTSTSSSGGAIYGGAMTMTVDNSQFINNTTKNYGGAIYITDDNGKDGYDLTIRNSVFNQNQSNSHGGAVYASAGARLSVLYSSFTENTTKGSGGAIYVTAGSLDANVLTFHKNSATTNGGGVFLTASTGILNRITATENTAKNGGFLSAGTTEIRVYNSTLQSNTATTNAGAITLNDGTTGGIYSTIFDQNSGGGSGGALFLYTNEGEVIVHSCTFTGNNGGSGGAVYASNKAIATFYNTTATDNTATKGGAFYFTTTGTTITMVGLTVSGNTATEGGLIIWGNSTGAKLYIDKSQYTDKDHTGEYDSTYWAAAIYNKLKVYDYSGEIPKYLDYKEESYDHMSNAVDVSSSDQLEAAINSGVPYIRVIADFEIDRTFYITGNTTIFSTLPRTLTRAATFGGDIFVVGETAEGSNALLLGGNATLVVGNPLSVQDNLLTIDGNKDNMTVPVTGTVFFVYHSGIVDLHPNLSVINCRKNNNERTYNERYTMSLPNRIGGAVAIIGSGVMNVYGGYYAGNELNEEDTSSEETRLSVNGAVFYNNSTLRIYDGVFENNVGARGTVVYNYRMLKVYGGQFLNNVATTSGGVLYTPNSASAHMHIGSVAETGTEVLMQGNTAQNYGGALYSSALSALVIYGNTSFIENQALTKQGGAISAYGQLTARDTLFSGNTAKNHGGAIYAANSNNNYVTRYNTFENCTFENNQATLGGAISLYASDSDFDNGALAIINNSTFTANSAASPTSATTASYGGAIYMERQSELTVTDTTFTQNSARTEGGAIYAGGESVINATDCTFTGNTAVNKHGGGIALHSALLTADKTTFTGNSAATNGGALYVSYSSARDINSIVKLTNASVNDNVAEGYGAAIYATRHTITTDHRILDIRDTEFSRNTSTAGALYLLVNVPVFTKNVTFTENVATEESGGAITAIGTDLEIDGATFTANSTKSSGGAISMTKSATVTLNSITATANTAENVGGFLYNGAAELKLYNSTINNNTSVNNGGALALYDDAVTSVYATTFDGNTSTDGNGGAVFAYTGGTLTLLHGCTLENNTANFGGGIYASNKSAMEIYRITATGNNAKKGGFLYETTIGTTILLVGATVSGNTASAGGPIIWGNSTGAVLNINKSLFTDNDAAGALDDAYWAAAIVNALTVNDSSATTTTYTDYVSNQDVTDKPTTQKTPVPVQEIFDLAQNSSDANINSYYNKLPRLDNSSNFMSKNVTTFPNINGGTVTVDTFVYPTSSKADNCTVGEGLLIYQAMLYKQAHPDEEVYIDISAYRFSTQAAVNINRNGRYFGYMRQLAGVDYDEYGFVRVAYLLVSAAKMGIHVNAIGQLDGYPLTAGEDMITYFGSKADLPCDPAYVENGVVSDYLNFRFCEWPLGSKGGTDMMHTKMCAVSHYLDMNGVEHQNAIWTSSSNLDGINSSGTNANWKLQTGTIVSGHADLYRIATNYLRLVEKYSRYQEGVYEFQNLINAMNTEQTKLISEGRGNEIAADEQIVYLGSETDDVFELYFTPLGGGTVAWDELNSPYCKYLRKLYNSEDYILFSWNAAEYSGGFALGQDMENMIIEAFHQNRNPNNKIYANMESFDPTTFNDLKVGTDIGYVSINKWERGQVHNKDLMFSYVENGQRYYVTLHNSTNMHSGSMGYQSNFALVIKETTCAEDSVFSTFAQNTTTQDFVEHTYGDEQTYMPSTTDIDGYTYRACTVCGHIKKTGVVHQDGEWVVDREPTVEQNGIRHKNCSVCGERIKTQELRFAQENQVLANDVTGKTFTNDPDSFVDTGVDQLPKTFEAVLQLSARHAKRGGVILGNYGADGTQVNFEVYYSGQPRLFYVNENGERADLIFQTDVRSDKPVHLALTVDDQIASLYINGTLAETKTLPVAYPTSASNFKIGGDNRTNYLPFFNGRIYSAALFNDVRTAEEISRDLLFVTDDADGSLLYTGYLTEKDLYMPAGIQQSGKTFTAATKDIIPHTFVTAPLTLEATLQLSPSVNGAGGVIVGNGQINFEIAELGKPNLVFVETDGTKHEHLFTTDVRSDKPVHLALTINRTSATLYVDGVPTETVALTAPIPSATAQYHIGGDTREDNSGYFRGTLYSVNLFGDVRTESEISADMLIVTDSTPSLLYSAYYTVKQFSLTAQFFTADISSTIPLAVDQTPYTIEAVVRLPKHHQGRGGVILGNYSGGICTEPELNFEIYDNGRPRLFVRDKYYAFTHYFSTDVRSDKPVHLALTIDGLTATLYVDGEFAETATLEHEFAATYQNFRIGGDNREGNAQYFKGAIHSVSLFEDVRTPEEIRADVSAVPTDTDGLLYSASFPLDDTKTEAVNGINGQTFNGLTSHRILAPLNGSPRTIEAVIQLPADYTQRGGVVFGNYSGMTSDELNLEIYQNGTPRLYYKVGGVAYNHFFTTDIRSSSPTYLAVTIDGQTVSLYVNGTLCETGTLQTTLSDIRENFCIGGDNRTGNEQYFKGTIYSVNVFSEVRTEEQVRQDRIVVSASPNTLLYSKQFTTTESKLPVDMQDGKTFDAFNRFTIDHTFTAPPQTIETIVWVSPDFDERAGVIVGNYDNSLEDQLNLEVFDKGQVRLFFFKEGQRVSHIFNADIRSDSPVHLALTIDNCTATLYVNGSKVDVAVLPVTIPNATKGFCIGTDNRAWNTQYFKGRIYAVNLYSQVKTAEQIQTDAFTETVSTEGLLYSQRFTKSSACVGNASGVHTESEWIVDFDATQTAKGIKHKECTGCKQVLTLCEIAPIGQTVDYTGNAGLTPTDKELFTVDALSGTPRTFEMSFILPKSYGSHLRGGVLFSNYNNGTQNQISIEIYTNGQARFWYKVNGVSYAALFKADVRSDSFTHLAFTVDGTDISLYINGVYSETITMAAAVPTDCTNSFCVGGDYRYQNAQYFKGTIYSVNVFDDVRTAEEIANDAVMVTGDSEGLLYSRYFSNEF